MGPLTSRYIRIHSIMRFMTVTTQTECTILYDGFIFVFKAKITHFYHFAEKAFLFRFFLSLSLSLHSSVHLSFSFSLSLSLSSIYAYYFLQVYHRTRQNIVIHLFQNVCCQRISRIVSSVLFLFHHLRGISIGGQISM